MMAFCTYDVQLAISRTQDFHRAAICLHDNVFGSVITPLFGIAIFIMSLFDMSVMMLSNG